MSNSRTDSEVKNDEANSLFIYPCMKEDECNTLLLQHVQNKPVDKDGQPICYWLLVKNGTNTSVSYYYGLGADYAITNNLAMTVQWNRAKGNSSTGILDLFSGGLSYIFS